MVTFSVSGTPNPNSVKITTDDGAFIDQGLAAFNSASEAEGHPLGEALFAHDGLENVLITPAFVTITKQAKASWETLMPGVKDTLRSHLISE